MDVLTFYGSEIDQLKERINKSGIEGIETAYVREDYEPAGDLMMRSLLNSGEYVQRRVPMHDFNSKWKIFKTEMAPY